MRTISSLLDWVNITNVSNGINYGLKSLLLIVVLAAVMLLYDVTYTYIPEPNFDNSIELIYFLSTWGIMFISYILLIAISYERMREININPLWILLMIFTHFGMLFGVIILTAWNDNEDNEDNEDKY